MKNVSFCKMDFYDESFLCSDDGLSTSILHRECAVYAFQLIRAKKNESTQTYFIPVG